MGEREEVDGKDVRGECVEKNRRLSVDVRRMIVFLHMCEHMCAYVSGMCAHACVSVCN